MTELDDIIGFNQHFDYASSDNLKMGRHLKENKKYQFKKKKDGSWTFNFIPLYTVVIRGDFKELETTCQCQHQYMNRSLPVCSHRIAALLVWADETGYSKQRERFLKENHKEGTDNKGYFVSSKKLETKSSFRNANALFNLDTETFLIGGAAGCFYTDQPEKFDWQSKPYPEEVYSVSFISSENEDGFLALCSCGCAKDGLVCVHIHTITNILLVTEDYGPEYIKNLPSMVRMKRELLHNLGINENSPLAKEVTFGLKKGILQILKGPDGLNSNEDLKKALKKLGGNRKREKTFEQPALTSGTLNFVFQSIYVRDNSIFKIYPALKIESSPPQNGFVKPIPIDSQEWRHFIPRYINASMKRLNSPEVYFSDSELNKRDYFDDLDSVWSFIADYGCSVSLPHDGPLEYSIEKERAKLKLRIWKNSDITFSAALDVTTGDGETFDEYWTDRNEIMFFSDEKIYLLESFESYEKHDKRGDIEEILFTKPQAPIIAEALLIPSLREGGLLEIEESLGMSFIPLEMDPNFIVEISEEESDKSASYNFKPIFSYQGTEVNALEEAIYSTVIQDGGEVKIVERDISNEKTHMEFFSSLHPKFTGTKRKYSLPIKEAEKNFWLAIAIGKLQAKGYEVRLLDKIKAPEFLDVEPEVSFTSEADNDWLNINAEIRWMNDCVGIIDIVKAIRNDEDFVVLPSGKIARIPSDLLEKIKNLIEVGETKDGALRIRDIHVESAEALGLHNAFIEASKSKLLRIHQISPKEAPEVPAMLTATLRPYQTEGYHRLILFYEIGWGFCLSDEMGLGKTIQAISLLCYVRGVKKVPNAVNLVICPTNVLENWRGDTEKFAPELKLIVYHGGEREVLTQDKLVGTDVVITTFGILNRDIEALRMIPWHVIVIDEIQFIRNRGSKAYKHVMELKSHHRVGLSGTIVQNSSEDVFTVYNFLNPGMLGDHHKFSVNFSNAIDKHLDREAMGALNKKISIFTLGRKKKDVAKDLPEKSEQIVYCVMDKEQREEYDTTIEFYRKKILNELESYGVSNFVGSILPMLVSLKRLCCHPKLAFKAGTDKHKNAPDSSIKNEELMNRVIQILNADPTNKILIFSEWTSYLDMVEKKLRGCGIQNFRIQGNVDPKKRQFQANQFNEVESDKRVFLLQIKSGGIGLNLYGANYVFIMEPTWNPSVEDQAVDRAHRIGQTRAVNIYRMICSGTIEEKIMKLQNRKRAIKNKVESGENSILDLTKLTIDDIRMLIE
jgi:hypothetical protein